MGSIFDSTAGRVGLGVMTGGTSELARAAGGAISGGGGINDMLGINNNFQAYNPYAPDYLQGMVNNQGQLYGQQQALAQALQQQMAGQGPNPAQTQYLANVQNNIANAQGLIASQRGLNPALAARMGANEASKANQEASLGSALLQQQQQLAATSNLGNLYGQIQQGNQGYQQLYNQGVLGAQGLNQKTEEGNVGRNAQLIGGVLNAAGRAAAMAADGGVVPGIPAKGADLKKNDKVPILAQAGEIIVPNSQSHDPEKAKEFIDELFKQGSKKKEVGYGDVLSARRKRKS